MTLRLMLIVEDDQHRSMQLSVQVDAPWLPLRFEHRDAAHDFRPAFVKEVCIAGPDGHILRHVLPDPHYVKTITDADLEGPW